jgi:type I restriction enzyme M protein
MSDERESGLETYLERALADGHLAMEQAGRGERIRYAAVGRSENWKDPEEKVRAEYYAELIYRYGYPPERIGVEVTVPDRSPNDFADLIVFRDKERKDPFAVIECKAENVSTPQFEQAVEQAWGNGNAFKFRAAYVGVVAGQTRRFLDCSDKALERDRNRVADLPSNYGKPPRYKFAKGSGLPWRDIGAVSKGDLLATIDKTHQTLWGGGRLSPPAAFGEFCKLIFVKVRDEQRAKKRKNGEPYDFQILTEESDSDLGARIRKLYEAERAREPEVFTEGIKIDDATLRRCVEHLESINFSATDLDTKGVAFERFLDGFFKGDFGQYFTPREIIQFCIAMLPPKAENRVLDTSCGSGGFLLYAMDHVRHEAEAHIEDPIERFREWHDFARERLFGIEINDEISRVAKMNMILHEDGHTNVIAVDGLEDFSVIARAKQEMKPGSFDLVLTNPPFGAVVKAAEKGLNYLDRFELSRRIGKQSSARGEKQKAGKAALVARTSVKTEILFLERIHDFLRPGGRAAIVVPDGILTNDSLQGVREWVMEKFQILAVISLPQEAFQHSGAGVKASLLFLRKRTSYETPDDDEAVFMAAPANIGYDATGRANYRIEVLAAELETRRVRKSSDLYTYEADEALNAKGQWEEAKRYPPDLASGLLGQYSRFQERPADFFA